MRVCTHTLPPPPPYKDEGRDRDDASTVQGRPKIASKLLEGRDLEKTFPCSPQEESTLPTFES